MHFSLCSRVFLFLFFFLGQGSTEQHFFFTASGNCVQDRLTHLGNDAWDNWNRNPRLMINQEGNWAQCC